MSKFCTACGRAVREGAKQEECLKYCTKCDAVLKEGQGLCIGCGAAVLSVYPPVENQPPSPVCPEDKENTPKTTFADSTDSAVDNTKSSYLPQKVVGFRSYIWEYIGQSLVLLKNPKHMIPTIVLGIVWLILALLSAFGINPMPVRILSFLTFAQGGMFHGVIGAVGGIIGKVVVAAFLNATIVPLFRKKKPFSGLGGGIKGFFGSLAIKSIDAVSPLLGGVGFSMLIYAFMNSTQSLQNSMVGIVAFIMLLQSMGSRNGFLWGLLFSAAGTLSKGRMPSHLSVNRFVSGMALGFALSVVLSAVGLRWCVWLGFLFLMVTFGFVMTSKKKKGVATV